jgi:hypothetical protein
VKKLKIISDLRTHIVDIVFLEKWVKMYKEKQPIKAACNRPIEERKRWSTGLTDGQRNPTLTVGP